LEIVCESHAEVERVCLRHLTHVVYGIQHAHILHVLGDPLAGKLRLRLCRQGLKRLDQKRRGRTNKTAATIGLLSELVIGSGMDYTKWDDTVLATAALFGFY